MKIQPTAVALLASLTVMSACAPHAADPRTAVGTSHDLTFSPAGLNRVRDRVRADIVEDTIAGAVLVLDQGGETVLLESYGHRDIGTRDPMRNDAIFRIISMTKPVTSVAPRRSNRWQRISSRTSPGDRSAH